MAVKEHPAQVQSGDPLRATYEIKFEKSVFFAQVEPGPRITLSTSSEKEPFGNIRLGSAHSGAIWIGSECIAEFDFDRSAAHGTATAKVTPVVEGRRQPDAVLEVDPISYLLQEAVRRGVV